MIHVQRSVSKQFLKMYVVWAKVKVKLQRSGQAVRALGVGSYQNF